MAFVNMFCSRNEVLLGINNGAKISVIFITVPYIFSLKINPSKTKDISLNDNY